MAAVDVDLPAGQRWLRLAITHSGPDFGLVAVDPDGRVRLQYWGKAGAERAVLGPDPARSSCGSVPGPLPGGRWRVQVFADADTRVAVDWGAGEVPEGTLPAAGERRWADPELRLDPELFTRRHREDRGWYRGDFHAHTRASDGRQSAAELTAQARARGLDFFSVTEHNLLTTGWPDDDLLVVPGIEVTSDGGHFNALGVRRWLDWRPSADDGGCATSQGMARLLAEARAQGAVASLNHPLLDPWRWDWPGIPIDAFHVMEIWNDPTWPGNAEANEATLRLWSRLWDDGHRVVGIGGSDTHLLPDDSYVPGGSPSVLGDPWTAVLADGLSVDAVLAAVRAGRVYLSRGPVLDPYAVVGHDRHPPGELPLDRPTRVRLVVDVRDAPPGATVRWVGTAGADQEWDPRAWPWARAEVRGADGDLLAVTNPFWAATRTA